MALLAALLSDFGELPGQFIRIVSDAEAQRQFPLVNNGRTFHTDADTERAEILVAVGFEFWLVEDFL